MLAEQVRRSAEHVAEARALLEDGREVVAALLYSDSRYEAPAPVTAFVLESLQACQEAGMAIEMAVHDYGGLAVTPGRPGYRGVVLDDAQAP